MKTVLRNPLFYLSILLAGALVFQIAQFVQGQTTGIWQPPTASPPGGQPEAPIDTGTSNQEKRGGLKILGNFEVRGGEGIQARPISTSTKLVQILTTGNPQINFSDDFGIGGIRLYNGQIQARDKDRVDWFPLGAGTGGTGGGGVLSTEKDVVVMLS